jgi:tetratricopeptide (TPR) repeat protein
VVVATADLLALHESVDVDLDGVRGALEEALHMSPGMERDRALQRALATTATVLEDELYADWAIPHRDDVERLRAEARRALAMDRGAGHGCCSPADVLDAWRSVHRDDPADEEACRALVGSLLDAGDRAGAIRALQLTRGALADLGLSPSRPLRDLLREIGDGDHGLRAAEHTAMSTADVRALARAGTVLRRRLAPRSAESVLRQAAAAASTVPEDDVRALLLDVQVQLAELARDLHDDAVAAAHHVEAARSLASGDAEVARVWSVAGSLPYRRGDLGEAIAVYRRGLDQLAGTDVAARIRLMTDLGFALGRRGQLDESISMLGEACDLLVDADDPRLASVAHDHLAMALMSAGRLHDALRSMEVAFAAAGPLDDDTFLLPLHIHRAGLLGRCGRHGEGLADAKVAVRLATDHGDDYALAVALLVRAEILESRGDVEQALEARDQELELLERVGNRRHAASAQAARARLLSVLDRAPEAREAAERALDAARAVDDVAFLRDIRRTLAPTASATRPARESRGKTG